MNTLSSRLVWARTQKKLSQEELAKLSGVSQGSIGHLESGLRQSSRRITAIADVLGINPLWLAEGKGDPSTGTVLAAKQTEIKSAYTLVSAETTESHTEKIEYWDVKGSCGGGFLNYEQMPKGHLIKEASFFNKYGLKPENAFAIYADGDSMAEFIVDGDIVIFDKSKTEPRSGEIFAIEHPDGLRIKVLRRSIDGTWTLESKNQDKRKYPDEIIPPGSHELLKIHGQFVYRQGG